MEVLVSTIHDSLDSINSTSSFSPTTRPTKFEPRVTHLLASHCAKKIVNLLIDILAVEKKEFITSQRGSEISFLRYHWMSSDCFLSFPFVHGAR